MKVLFIYLKAFTGAGGLEKFNRAFLKALQEVCEQEGIEVKAYSPYGEKVDERYFKSANFRGFDRNKIGFALKTIQEGLRSDLVILGHINLSPVGVALKKMNSNVKTILITHGIEVWHNLSKLKKQMLKEADKILTVSSFTKQKLSDIHNVPLEKMTIFPNTIDPYFKIPTSIKKSEHLLKRYKLSKDTKIILTIARLASSEKNKGYDKVIQVLPEVIKEFPTVKYLIVGKWDEKEIERIKKLIGDRNLINHVILTGYIHDEELPDHYLISDVFVMPSKKEGFGIVFLEALACGKPLIAGNKDGSADALLNGKLGILIDPDNLNEISQGIIKVLKGEIDKRILDSNYLKSMVLNVFGYDKYKERLKEIISVKM